MHRWPYVPLTRATHPRHQPPARANAQRMQTKEREQQGSVKPSAGVPDPVHCCPPELRAPAFFACQQHAIIYQALSEKLLSPAVERKEEKRATQKKKKQKNKKGKERACWFWGLEGVFSATR
ncbi:hypothetical protein TIFTF001_012861 [Ficus carica]|uniref:Uncharacterized protein n=1 Tax=Ficus carica TaxID=3494 RepID=A0AA88A2H6_FICCA|nr:hypothetical protein TIFTF001_012861 [Ficus carica]